MQDAAAHAAIAARISEGLLAGRLPGDEPTTTWVGYGSGKVCDGCGAEIGRGTVEHELDFEGGHVTRLHAECAIIWSTLRRYSEARARSSAPTPSSAAG